MNTIKSIKRGLSKKEKSNANENTETKFPFLQRFVSETRGLKNEIKQIIRV